MTTRKVEMMLAGTKGSLDDFLNLLYEMQVNKVVRIVCQSYPYPSRNDADIYRVYISASFESYSS